MALNKGDKLRTHLFQVLQRPAWPCFFFESFISFVHSERSVTVEQATALVIARTLCRKFGLVEQCQTCLTPRDPASCCFRNTYTHMLMIMRKPHIT